MWVSLSSCNAYFFEVFPRNIELTEESSNSRSLLSKSKFRIFIDGEKALTRGIEFSQCISSSSKWRCIAWQLGLSLKSVFSKVEHAREFVASKLCESLKGLLKLVFFSGVTKENIYSGSSDWMAVETPFDWVSLRRSNSTEESLHNLALFKKDSLIVWKEI